MNMLGGLWAACFLLEGDPDVPEKAWFCACRGTELTPTKHLHKRKGPPPVGTFFFPNCTISKKYGIILQIYTFSEGRTYV